jgi:hypothetical protein
MVEDAEYNTKEHLTDAKNDGQLFLVRIGERYRVCSQVPRLHTRRCYGDTMCNVNLTQPQTLMFV